MWALICFGGLAVGCFTLRSSPFFTLSCFIALALKFPKQQQRHKKDGRASSNLLYRVAASSLPSFFHLMSSCFKLNKRHCTGWNITVKGFSTFHRISLYYFTADEKILTLFNRFYKELLTIHAMCPSGLFQKGFSTDIPLISLCLYPSVPFPPL